MNQLLLDPQQNDYPDKLASCLDVSGDGSQFPTCVTFNAQGTYMAVGTNTGTCIIVDYDTLGVAKQLRGHTRPITSVCWSRDSCTLLTTSSDFTAVLWDVLHGTVLREVQCNTMVLQGSLNPRNSEQAVLCCFNQGPFLANFQSNTLELLVPPPPSTVAAAAPAAASVPAAPKAKARPESVACSSACYLSGSRIAMANKAGQLYFVSLSDATARRQAELVYQIKSRAGIQNMAADRSGLKLALNCSDRCIRLLNVKTRTLLHTLQESVSKPAWRQCCFSSDGEYLLAGSAQPEHKLVIWCTYDGRLTKMLYGPKEGMLGLAWHPSRPFVATCSKRRQGVYMWNKRYAEDWTAFAPNVTKLLENIEYVEKEDEFDLVTEAQALVSTDNDVIAGQLPAHLQHSYATANRPAAEAAAAAAASGAAVGSTREAVAGGSDRAGSRSGSKRGDNEAEEVDVTTVDDSFLLVDGGEKGAVGGKSGSATMQLILPAIPTSDAGQDAAGHGAVAAVHSDAVELTGVPSWVIATSPGGGGGGAGGGAGAAAVSFSHSEALQLGMDAAKGARFAPKVKRAGSRSKHKAGSSASGAGDPPGAGNGSGRSRKRQRRGAASGL